MASTVQATSQTNGTAGTTTTTDPSLAARRPSALANKYRGATVEDLDPPPALSTSPTSPISSALLAAFERDYTHLTVVSPSTKHLLGYVSIPRLRELLTPGSSGGGVLESDPVEKAMVRFQRKGRRYVTITMDTPLEQLEGFFDGELAGGGKGEKQDFAVVTDAGRRFVLGVATRADLDEFVRRRPSM